MASAAPAAAAGSAAPATFLPPRGSSPIRERPGGPRKFKRRKGLRGVGVLEAPGYVPKAVAKAEAAKAAAAAKRSAEGGEEAEKRHTYRRLGQARRAPGLGGAKEGVDEEAAALDRLPPGFAEDYFAAPGNARSPAPALLLAAQAPPAEGEKGTKVVTADGAGNLLKAWLELLKLGFSVLVQGVGSKKKLLDRFADEILKPWGAAVVRLHGFNARFSLLDCLREVLEQLHPEAAKPGGVGVDSVVAALCAARRGGNGTGQCAPPARPLCFVVHNLESLPAIHQTSLSTLAASAGVNFIVSVDSIWAPLTLSPHTLKNFNFCREEAHTFESYAAEHVARYPGGPPAWSDPFARRAKAPKASLGLVLRSLTRSHRELVQAIAEYQLEGGGRSGISKSRLLEVATDRMIASSATKLQSLLNELRDHEVVAQKGGADGGTLLYLTCDAKVLQRLAQGQDPEDSEEEESDLDGA